MVAKEALSFVIGPAQEMQCVLPTNLSANSHRFIAKPPVWRMSQSMTCFKFSSLSILRTTSFSNKDVSPWFILLPVLFVAFRITMAELVALFLSCSSPE